MSYIFPIILIVLGIIIFVYLLARKFYQLTVLNVDSIPELRQQKKKDELLKSRMEKKANEFRSLWKKNFTPAIHQLKEIQLAFRKYVGKMEKDLLKEKEKKQEAAPVEEKFAIVKDLNSILQDAQYSFEHEDWAAAEKKFIAVLAIDHKNFDAYYGLGQVYVNQGQLNEAEETFIFLHQLYSDNVKVLNKLAELLEERGKIDDAIVYLQQAVILEDSKASIFYKIADLFKNQSQLLLSSEAIRQAVEIEPQNPKYLDFFLENSIMLKNKIEAEEIYRQLRMVNPENQKLVSFRERIDKI